MGQMRGVGIVFSRLFDIEIWMGVIIGAGIVFFYAGLGGMKGITYTQVAQYCVLIFAYMVPAIFISILITGNPVPQLGFGSKILNEDIYLLEKLNLVLNDLGFNDYTESIRSKIDVFCITAALMAGTAGLPHVIVRFFTVPRVKDARTSAGWALMFIAILYTTAPAVSSFSRLNFIDTIHNSEYQTTPQWFKNWENIGLIAWKDKNPFPNKAKDIIEFLKNNPVGENNKYSFSKPKSYTFNFKRSPDQTVSELFGHGVDAKWANILYIAQIPEKDIQEIEKLPSAYRRIRTAISKEQKMFFKNEIFSIKKIR